MAGKFMGIGLVVAVAIGVGVFYVAQPGSAATAATVGGPRPTISCSEGDKTIADIKPILDPPSQPKIRYSTLHARHKVPQSPHRQAGRGSRGAALLDQAFQILCRPAVTLEVALRVSTTSLAWRTT